MAEISVTFTHPVDRRSIVVTLEDSMTADEAIGNLIASNAIPKHEGGYRLQIKGGRELQGNETLSSAGVKDGAVLNIVSSTDAGK